MIRRVTAWFAFAAACAPAQAGPPQYTLQEVTGRPLAQWNAYDLGPQGQVVGRSYDNNVNPRQSRAFVWQNGVMSTLDGPGGETITEGWCMDSTGVVYGGYADRRFPVNQVKMHPARWVGGVPQPYANNNDINSTLIMGCSPTTGVAVGWAKPFVHGAPGWRGEYGYANEMDFGNGDPVMAFIWSSDTGSGLFRGMRMTGDAVVGVNDAGQAAINFNGNELNGAGIFDPRFGAVLLPGLGVGLPNAGWSTQTYAINQGGQIVGNAQAAGGREHPVRWDRDVLTDLGLLPGFIEGRARDINDAGVIVGALSNQSFEFGVMPTAGFVFVDGTMYNLNQLIVGGGGFVVQEGLALNKAGQILVVMTSSPDRYAVLTPVP